MSSEAWNRLVLQAEEGTFFHSFEWSEVIRRYGEETGSFTPKHVLVHDEETGELLGVLPLFLDRRRHRLVSLPFGDYGGPCVSPSADREKVLTLMFREVEREARRVGEVRLKSLPDEYAGWLRNLHFTTTPHMYTFLLEIGGLSLDALWKRFRRDARRGVKKAVRQGVTVERIQDEKLMETYYQIYLVSMRHIRASIRPFTFFKAMWEVLFPKGLLHVLLARHRDIPIAGLIFLPWKRTLHIYGNVSIPEHRHLHPNDLLYYEAIRWGVEKGFHVVDFGLTPLSRESGLYQFKERWGGTPTVLSITIKRYGLAKISHKTKLLMKKILRLMRRA